MRRSCNTVLRKWAFGLLMVVVLYRIALSPSPNVAVGKKSIMRGTVQNPMAYMLAGSSYRHSVKALGL